MEITRYTPTRVGRTEETFTETGTDQVHPHSRGENLVSNSYIKPNSGTPPLAWGEQNGDVVEVVISRYTPTRVGRTVLDLGGGSSFTVHPHSRGENTWSPPIGPK